MEAVSARAGLPGWGQIWLEWPVVLRLLAAGLALAWVCSHLL